MERPAATGSTPTTEGFSLGSWWSERRRDATSHACHTPASAGEQALAVAWDACGGAVASRPEALQKVSRVGARLQGGQLWLVLSPFPATAQGINYHKSLVRQKKQSQATEAVDGHAHPVVAADKTDVPCPHGAAATVAWRCSTMFFCEKQQPSGAVCLAGAQKRRWKRRKKKISV